MMFWALVFAADMAAEWVAEERKKRDRNAMVGNLVLASVGWVVVRIWREWGSDGVVLYKGDKWGVRDLEAMISEMRRDEIGDKG